jgi:hypothetical protein
VEVSGDTQATSSLVLARDNAVLYLTSPEPGDLPSCRMRCGWRVRGFNTWQFARRPVNTTTENNKPRHRLPQIPFFSSTAHWLNQPQTRSQEVTAAVIHILTSTGIGER